MFICQFIYINGTLVSSQYQQRKRKLFSSLSWLLGCRISLGIAEAPLFYPPDKARSRLAQCSAPGRALISGASVTPPESQQCCRVPELPPTHPGPIFFGPTSKLIRPVQTPPRMYQGKHELWGPTDELIPASSLKTKQDLYPSGKGQEAALPAKLLGSPKLLHRAHKVYSTYWGKRRQM